MAESKKGCGKYMSYKVGENIRIEHPLKTEIYKKGYTIKQFADLVGISRFTLNAYFTNRHIARGDTINLISKGLDIPYEKVSELCHMNN